MSQCPDCSKDDSKVKETRFNDAGTWRARKRQCRQCSYTYWTLEIPEEFLGFNSIINQWSVTARNKAASR